MNGLLRNTDVLAGAGATVLFLIVVFALGLSPLIGLGLALVTYLGLRLALPKPDTGAAAAAAAEAATLDRCEEQVTSIRQFAGWAEFNGRPAVEERLLAIHGRARRILDAIKQDPNKRGAAEQYLTGYLLPITEVLAQYVRLAGRDVALAREELAEFEAQTLPLIERRLTTLFEQIHSADLAALEIDTKMLAYTLQPIEIAPKQYTTDGPALSPEEGEARPRRARGQRPSPEGSAQEYAE